MKREERVEQTLLAYDRLHDETSYPPTYAELANEMGCSHATAYSAVVRCRLDGFMRDAATVPRASRSIVLTPEGRKMVSKIRRRTLKKTVKKAAKKKGTKKK